MEDRLNIRLGERQPNNEHERIAPSAPPGAYASCQLNTLYFVGVLSWLIATGGCKSAEAEKIGSGSTALVSQIVCCRFSARSDMRHCR